MPTIFIIFGFKFHFFSNDHLPIHVHVTKGNATAKLTIYPVELVVNKGFKAKELKMIKAIVEENTEVIAEHWNNFFNNTK